MRKALERRGRAGRVDALFLSNATYELGLTRRALAKFADAVALTEESLAICRRKLPAGHLATDKSAGLLGHSLMGLGRFEEAEPNLREARALGYASGAPEADRADLDIGLGVCLLRLGRFDEAEPLLPGGHQFPRATTPTADPRRMEPVRDWIVDLYDQTGRKADADAWRRQ